MRPTAIPDRWENYNPIGKKVEGTRFIPFKVPLKECVSVNVESAKRLDDKILLRRIPNLGLIIDLTNTLRYYNPNVFAKEGVQYAKILIPGKHTPTKRITAHFIQIVNNFLSHNINNDKLIGVHCTHGINRTGYLICYYMISQLTMEPKEAMDRFAIARGYQIERINYINDLKNLKLVIEQDCKERHEEHKNNCNISVNRSSDNSRCGSMKYENWHERSSHLRGRSRKQRKPEEYEKNSNTSVKRSSDNSRCGSMKYENWRERSSHLRGRSRQRSNPEEYQKNYNGDVNRSSNNSRGRFSIYEKSGSHPRWSNQAEERSNNSYAHAVRYTDHHATISNPRGLSLDYYSTKPTTQHYKYNTHSNARRKKN